MTCLDVSDGKQGSRNAKRSKSINLVISAETISCHSSSRKRLMHDLVLRPPSAIISNPLDLLRVMGLEVGYLEWIG